MEYREFEKALNEGLFEEIRFSIDGYNHYSSCRINYVKGKSQDNLFYPYIEFHLTQDDSEYCRFHKRFRGTEKMFHIKGKGSFTLKDIWKKVLVSYVRYSDGRERDSID